MYHMDVELVEGDRDARSVKVLLDPFGKIPHGPKMILDRRPPADLKPDAAVPEAV